jgi:hypothetical protein
MKRGKENVKKMSVWRRKEKINDGIERAKRRKEFVVLYTLLRIGFDLFFYTLEIAIMSLVRRKKMSSVRFIVV